MCRCNIFVTALAVCSVFTTVFAQDSVTYTTIEPHHGLSSNPGEDVELNCTVTGPADQERHVEWWRNDDEVEESDDKYKITSNSSMTTLKVKDVDYLKDLGEYMCVFKTHSGPQANATVELQAEAYVNKFETSKNLVQGDTLTLRCDAYGYPTPSATWYKDDEMLSSSDRVSFEEYNDVVNGTLKIKEMDYDDAGDYQCTASNAHGEHSSTIIIRVKDKFAALWPFLGICAEVLILCIIIFIYEKRRAKKMAAEDAKEEADHLTNSHANRDDDVRQRKV